MGRLFGTDGVRGVANADLTAELALGLSVAAAHVLAEAGTFEGHKPVAVVGRDPRASGEFLEAAVVAGLASAGVDVLRVGVLPTPAVAFLTGELGADLGVMLSASHNAMPDNGVKFLARGGHKLDDELEDRIESVYEEHRTGAPWDRPTGSGVGSTPTSRTSTPALARPATTAASRNSPDARGSRPTTAVGRCPSNVPASASTCAAATERPRAISAVRSALATPRTPSVPKSRPTVVSSELLKRMRLTSPSAPPETVRGL